MMTALCDLPMPEADSARSSCGSVRPPRPRAPILRKLRRERPSQNFDPLLCGMVSTGGLHDKREHCDTQGRGWAFRQGQLFVEPVKSLLGSIARDGEILNLDFCAREFSGGNRRSDAGI